MKELIELLETAYRDMMLVKQDSRYIFDPDAFHIVEGDKCHVCIAGSIMAKTLNCDISKHLYPRDMGTEWCNKLELIDAIRADNVRIIYVLVQRLNGPVTGLTRLYNDMYNGIDKQGLRRGDDAEWFKLINNLKAKEDKQ
jgi:hypothetical protein